MLNANATAMARIIVMVSFVEVDFFIFALSFQYALAHLTMLEVPKIINRSKSNLDFDILVLQRDFLRIVYFVDFGDT